MREARKVASAGCVKKPGGKKLPACVENLFLRKRGTSRGKISFAGRFLRLVSAGAFRWGSRKGRGGVCQCGWEL